MYFTNIVEILGRFFVVFAQVAMIAAIVIVSSSLSKSIVEVIPIPSALNVLDVADAIFKGLTILISLLGIIIAIGIFIPTLIARTISTVNKLGLVWLLMSFVLGGLLISSSALTAKYAPTNYNSTSIYISVLFTIMMMIGAVSLIVSSEYKRRKLINALIDSENLVKAK